MFCKECLTNIDDRIKSCFYSRLLHLVPIVFFLFPFWIHAQSLDSLSSKVLRMDTTAFGVNNRLDSIKSSAAKAYHSLKNSYDSVVTAQMTR